DGAGELLAVVQGVAAGPGGVDVARDPLVAERLLRAGRVVARLGAHEHAAVAVPGDDRIAGAGGPDLRESAERGRVARVAGNARAHEGRTRVLGAVVAEPDRARRDRRAVGVAAVVVDGTVVIARTDHHPVV